MSLLLDWPQALTEAGVNVRTLNEWDKVQVSGGNPYNWREPDGEAAGMMHHHTATVSYDPNRDKASAYAGLGRVGTTRLYQEDYGDYNMFPVFTIANAYPAPISAGSGRRDVLDNFVKKNIPYKGTARIPDDDPKWYGNTHYINIEWILDGIGTDVDERVWDMMVTVCRVTNDLMSRPGHLWTPARHIGHGHHTPTRKIDLRIGQFANYDLTVQELRKDMGAMDPNCPWTSNTDYPPCEKHYTPETTMPLGNGAGEHQGQCSVPDQQHGQADYMFSAGRFKAGNQYRYDYTTVMTEGRYGSMEERAQ